MTMIERVGEGLARRINRRRGLNRAGSLVFGLVAAFAVDGLGRPAATAQRGCSFVTEGDCSCNLPNQTLCSAIKKSYCDGARCGQGCRYLTEDDPPTGVYPTGCWCSATCRYGDKRGYYQCCDCRCGAGRSTLCGCRRFVRVD
jgi:hypothetical protein